MSANIFEESESKSESKTSIGAKSFNETPYEEVVSLVHCPFTDLNALVEDVLSAGPMDPSVKRKRVQRQKNSKRVRKTQDQIDALKVAYHCRREWEKEDVLELSARTGLSSSQVYKWYWDQQKKDGRVRGKRWE